jgi:uncharacterized protein YcgL (UPF0745 family)
MKLWLVPASDAAATANIPKTLSGPIPKETRQNVGLTAEDCQHAWGTRSGHNDKKLQTMETGDSCLFYTSDMGRNQYNWIAKVSEIRRSPEVSKALWGTPDFEWVYFLEEPSRISLSVDQLAGEVAQFRPDYLNRAPMGIMPLDPKRSFHGFGSRKRLSRVDLIGSSAKTPRARFVVPTKGGRR